MPYFFRRSRSYDNRLRLSWERSFLIRMPFSLVSLSAAGGVVKKYTLDIRKAQSCLNIYAANGDGKLYMQCRNDILYATPIWESRRAFLEALVKIQTSFIRKVI